MGINLGKISEDYYKPQKQAQLNVPRMKIVGTTCANCVRNYVDNSSSWTWETKISAAAVVLSLLILCFIFGYFIYLFSRCSKDQESLPCDEWNDNDDQSKNRKPTLPKRDQISYIPSLCHVIVISKSMIDGFEESTNSSKKSVYEVSNQPALFQNNNVFKDAEYYELQNIMATWTQQKDQNVGITLL